MTPPARARGVSQRLQRAATVSVRSRRTALITIGAWLVLAVLLSAAAPRLADVEDNRTVNDPPASAQSVEARALEAKAFGPGQGTPAVIVLRNPSGLGAEGRREMTRVVGGLESLAASRRIGEPVSPLDSAAAARSLISGDRTTAQIIVPVLGSSSDDAFGETVDAIRRVAGTGHGDLEIAVTGPAGIARDAVKAFGSANLVLLAATVGLVLLLLLAIYRSPLLAVMPLLAVGIALTITNALGATLVDAGVFAVSSQAASIMTVLLFGLGTDYCLFIVARYREELAVTPDRYAAMQTAMRRLAEPLLSSAATIVLALFGLLLATLPALRGFGPFLALSVVVMVSVGLTFVPAAVCLLGQAATWPQRFAPRGESQLWRAIAGLVIRRPIACASSTVAVLAVLALGLTQYRESYNFISGFRVATESARGQHLLEEGFPRGALAPTTLLIAAPSLDTARPALSTLRTTIAAMPSVSTVTPPRIAKNDDVARLQIVYQDDPYGSPALDRTDRLRSQVPSMLADTPLRGARTLIGGESATSLDLRSANDRDLLVVGPVIAIVVLLVLALLLRSLVAPLYLVATLLASFAATIGLTVVALLTIGGDDGIGVRVTVYVFVFLVSLGVDYNILLMSRAREEIQRRGHREGIRLAVLHTGPVITSAGLILAGTFAVLMTQPIRELFQFGFAMAVGLLLDTFLIRGMLVPAITERLGNRAWWPRVASRR